MRGRFNDGRTSNVFPVTLKISDQNLEVTDENSGKPIVSWRLEDMQVLDEIKPNQPVRFSSSQNPDSRLTLSDAQTIQNLVHALPDQAKSSLRQTPSWGQVIAYVALVVAGLWGLYIGGPVILEVAANAIPISWEQKLGDKFIKQFEKIVGLNGGPSFCVEHPGNVALDRLAARLTAQVDSPFKFRIYVAKRKHVNAFAAPGGHIVIFDGLLQKADSADEVAGVIAHEIGHIVKRHSVNAMLRGYGVSYVFDLVFGSDGLASSAGQLSTSLSYGRDAEREADAVGLAILEKANISSDGFQNFFKRLSKKNNNLPGIVKYLSTHPTPQSRAALAVPSDKSRKPAMNDQEWIDLKNVCL